MMSTGRGEFECALGALLALDVAQIEMRRFRLVYFRLRAREHLRALEMVGDLDQRLCRDDLDIGTGPGGFGSARRRTDQAFLARVGADRGRQYAGHRSDRAIEAELAE